MSQIQVPKGWDSDILGNVLENEKGKKPKITSDQNFKSGLPYLDIKAIEKNVISVYGKKEDGVECSSDDVLIVWDGSRSGLTLMGKPGLVGSTLMKLKPKESILPNFLFYFLKSKYNLLNTKTKGAAIPHVNDKLFWNLDIPIPPKEIQEKIVQKLGNILEQIEEKKKNILELQRKKISLLIGKTSKNKNAINKFSQIYIGHKLDQIFLEFEKNQTEIVTLDTLLKEPLRNGKSTREIKDGIPNLKLSAVTFKDFGSHNIKLCNLSEDDAKDFWIKKNDILVERSNSLEFVGTSAIYEGEDSQFIFPDLMIRIRVNTDLIIPKFLAYYLDSSKVRLYFQKNAKGTAGSMPKISQPIIEKLTIPLPSLKDQKTALRKIHDFQKTIVIIEKQINSLKNSQENILEYIEQIPTKILDQAFSGKLLN